MKHQSSRTRAAAIARMALALACSGALLAASGCGWFRSKSVYEDSPQSRPLEVPPDLDVPAVDPAQQIPAVAADAGVRAAAPAPGAADELRVQDTVASTWRRLGIALERVDGATITDRAELLSVYSVSYRGDSFLLRVQEAEGGGSRVSAVTADGTPLSGGNSAALLGVLRQRLG